VQSRAGQRRAWLVLVAVLGTMALWTAQARALELVWTAPAACPSQADVKQRIDALLEAPGKPAASGAQSARASAKLTSTRSGYRLTLTLHGEGIEGTRSLSGNDCAELAETAAFLIAVAIDPSLPGAAPPAPEPAPTPEPPPAAPEPPAPAPLPPPKPAPTEVLLPFSLQVSGFGGLWSGGLPRPQTQAGGSVGIATGRVQIEFRGSSDFLARQNVNGGIEQDGMQHTGRFESRSVQFELALCHLWGARFFAGPCGSAALVRSFARGKDFTDNRHDALFWATASLAGQAGIRVNRWLEPFLEGGLGLSISERPRFVVRAAGAQADKPTDANMLVPYGRVGVRFRWQPTRTVALP
jgi:hypothetical protein